MEKFMNFLRRLRKHFNSRVFTSMLKSMIFVLAIPIIFNILVAMVSLASIDREMERYERSALEKAEDEVERTYEDAFQIMNWVKNNEVVIEYTKTDVRDYWTEFQLSQLLGEVVSSYSMVEMIYLYFPEFNYVISNQSNGEGQFFHERNYSESYEEWLILMDAEWRGKRGMLHGVNGNRKNIIASSILSGQLYSGRAILTMHLDGEKLEKKLDGLKLNDEDEIMVISRDKIIYSTMKNDFNVDEEAALCEVSDNKKINIQDAKYQIRSKKSGTSTLRPIYLENSSKLNAVVVFNWVFVSVTVILYIFISFILSFFITRRNYMPIQKIFSLLKEDGQDPWLNDYETMEYYVRNHIFRNRSMSNTLELYENDLKIVYMERILHGKILYLDSIREGAALYELQFSEGYTILVLYYVGGGEEEEEERYTKRELLEELIKEYITGVKQYYLLEEEDYFVAVYNGLAENEESFRRLIEAENQVMKHYLERKEKLSCEFYLSNVFDGLDNMYEAYTEVCSNHMKQEEKAIVCETGEEKLCSIERILELIKSNILNSNFSVADIADTFHISQSHLSRYFKQQMGVGVLDYIHKCRINLAKEMIKGNLNIRVKEVAEKTGFYNVSTFIRVFKKCEGITPGEYRNSL